MSDKQQLVAGAGEALEAGSRRLQRLRQNIADADANAIKDPKMVRECLRDASMDIRRIEQWIEDEVRPRLMRTAGNAKKREDDLSATVAALAVTVTQLQQRIAELERERGGGAQAPDLRMVR